MDDPLSMVSPLPPEDVRERLGAYGKEWRESKIPVSLRSVGVHTCRIVVDSDGFRLRFEPQAGRAPRLVWIGRVVASGEGSQIDVFSEPTRGSRASNVFLLGCIAVAWGWPALRVGAWWLPVVGVILMSGLIALSMASASRKQRGPCAAILAHVVDAKVSTASPAA
jgi:hypothetical protein